MNDSIIISFVCLIHFSLPIYFFKIFFYFKIVSFLKIKIEKEGVCLLLNSFEAYKSVKYSHY